jgi:hypothetical protein
MLEAWRCPALSNILVFDKAFSLQNRLDSQKLRRLLKDNHFGFGNDFVDAPVRLSAPNDAFSD